MHVKDIQLAGRLTVHLDEVRPGQGGLDLRTLLRALHQLNPTLPIMLEHLPNETEYDLAAAHVCAVAKAEGLTLA